MKDIRLLLIDCQNDFCIPTFPSGKKGALVVPGAEQDMERLTKFVNKNQKRFTEITATIDSHTRIQIFHPLFWVNSKGQNPPPFTLIPYDDVEKRVWYAFNPKWQSVALNYTQKLKEQGRFTLMVWPEHCLVQTEGHLLVPSLSEALYEWEKNTYSRTNWAVKGMNLFSEHYSCLKSEVIDDKDQNTKLNTQLIDLLNEADEIVVAGEALSHCLNFTVVDLIDNFGPDSIKKIVLLEDATSSVSGFEQSGKDFIKNMVARGMRVSTTKDW